MVMLQRDAHIAKVPLSIVVIKDGNTRKRREEQQKKANLPMDKMDAGNVIDKSSIQQEKVASLTVVIDDGNIR